MQWWDVEIDDVSVFFQVLWFVLWNFKFVKVFCCVFYQFVFLFFDFFYFNFFDVVDFSGEVYGFFNVWCFCFKVFWWFCQFVRVKVNVFDCFFFYEWWFEDVEEFVVDVEDINFSWFYWFFVVRKVQKVSVEFFYINFYMVSILGCINNEYCVFFFCYFFKFFDFVDYFKGV